MAKELFRNIPNKVQDLLKDVKSGKIGLPDLQRPFVWKDSKVRDLLDSMMKGYPIGYIMLWSSPEDYANKGHIGTGKKDYEQPEDLVIDGQQRLTALLAALYGLEVKDKEYKNRCIKISFNPMTREFAVWSQAYERNPEWISVVSKVFSARDDYDKSAVSKLRRAYIKSINESRQKEKRDLLTDDDEVVIEENINDLLALDDYTLPTLKIRSDASEEDVADIFVRVNSGGQNLTEKNFIETLLAVYDNKVHDSIDNFCSSSRIKADGTSYNLILDVDPGHLIRIAVGYGFRRARLKYAYMLLRGKNLETGEINADEREKNLEVFKNALDVATNLQNWHAFLNIFGEAGYLTGDMVASENAVVFCYVLYLIGKYDYKVKSGKLIELMRKWIFMSTTTSFYTGSTETAVEKQFADMRPLKNATDFVKLLESEIANRLTKDFFDVTLPKEMATSSTQSPAWFAYIAALNILGTPILFGTAPLSKYLLPGSNGTKKAIDKHHLFPKNYLPTIGIEDDRDRNQIANFAYVDYPTNISITDSAPSQYISDLKKFYGLSKFAEMSRQNALPDNFENMNYFEFLSARRILMAKKVKEAFEMLCSNDECCS